MRTPHPTLIVAFALALAATSGVAATRPTTMVQPELVKHVAPRAMSLRDAGVERIVARADRGLVQVLTAYGPSYFAWPSGVKPASFEVDVGSSGEPVVRAESDAVATAALDTVIERAIRAADASRAVALRPRP